MPSNAWAPSPAQCLKQSGLSQPFHIFHPSLLNCRAFILASPWETCKCPFLPQSLSAVCHQLCAVELAGPKAVLRSAETWRLTPVLTVSVESFEHNLKGPLCLEMTVFVESESVCPLFVCLHMEAIMKRKSRCWWPSLPTGLKGIAVDSFSESDCFLKRTLYVEINILLTLQGLFHYNFTVQILENWPDK